MTQGLATIEAAGMTIDHEAILKSLNLNPRDPKTQALLLVCDRYKLDPVLKHVVLITGNVYISRDGYLAIAHRSGQFDGMEVLEQGADSTHYFAKVAVYRKDMSHPFTFIGRFPKSKSMAKDYGPEMAVKCAEVMALRRAFNVTGVGAADERWDDEAMPERNGGTLPRPVVDVETGEVLSDAAPAPAIGGPPPTVATKRPPPKKAPTITELVTDHTVKLLVDDLNAIEDPKDRKEAWAEFMARFGAPADLKPEQFDEAAKYVAGLAF